MSASAATPCPLFCPWYKAGTLSGVLEPCAKISSYCASVSLRNSANEHACRRGRGRRGYLNLLACRAQATGLLDMLKAAIEDSSSALAREGALLVFSSLCQVVGKPAEPFLVPLLGNVLGCYCDKVRLSDLCRSTCLTLPCC